MYAACCLWFSSNTCHTLGGEQSQAGISCWPQYFHQNADIPWLIRHMCHCVYYRPCIITFRSYREMCISVNCYNTATQTHTMIAVTVCICVTGCVCVHDREQLPCITCYSSVANVKSYMYLTCLAFICTAQATSLLALSRDMRRTQRRADAFKAFFHCQALTLTNCIPRLSSILTTNKGLHAS